MAMGTPKKPINKKVDSTSDDEDDEDDNVIDQKKKKVLDDDDDDFDGPLDDLGYENFDAYDEDDDY